MLRGASLTGVPDFSFKRKDARNKISAVMGMLSASMGPSLLERAAVVVPGSEPVAVKEIRPHPPEACAGPVSRESAARFSMLALRANMEASRTHCARRFGGDWRERLFGSGWDASLGACVGRGRSLDEWDNSSWQSRIARAEAEQAHGGSKCPSAELAACSELHFTYARAYNAIASRLNEPGIKIPERPRAPLEQRLLDALRSEAERRAKQRRRRRGKRGGKRRSA